MKVQDETVKVGFLNHFSIYWMGGITYFKNLFCAMRTTQYPHLEPYILPPADEAGRLLLDFAKVLQEAKDENKNNEEYASAKYGVDVISHRQELGEKGEIAWIADFQHLHLPEMFDEKEISYRNQTFRALAENSRRVILSSREALKDFQTFAPDLAWKGRCLHFVSIPEGMKRDMTAEEVTSVKERLRLPEKFFYVPNQFWKHKNHKIVLEAVARLKRQGKEVHVVFSGKTFDVRFPHYYEELAQYIKENQIENCVHVLGVIELEDVYFLMRHCVALINPSRFEGWSSSVEEIKSIGKSIILSDLPVHREQNPPSAQYFDPEDSNHLAELMLDAWNTLKSEPDKELEKKAAKELPNRIKEFGEQFQDIVLEILEQKDEHHPLVSVVTVVYNLIKSKREEAFRRCVESVSGQDCPGIEHLVIDGGSTDGTIDLIEECLKQSKAKVRYLSSPDGGIYDAMNRGIRLARGRYVSFLNSDDYYHDHTGLRTSVAYLDRGWYDFSYSAVRMVDEEGNAVRHIHTSPDAKILFIEMPFSHQSMLFRRDAILELGGYDLRYKSASDYDLILRFALSGKSGVEVPLHFATFVCGGHSQVNMADAQHEVGRIYARLYGKFDKGMTEEDGYQLYIKKKMSKKLKEQLEPFLRTAFHSPAQIVGHLVVRRDSPLVSVIFPTDLPFQKDIGKTIDSIYGQTLKQIEVIVALDACLAEETKKQLEAWQAKDERVKLYSFEQEGYLLLNSSIQRASGKAIYIVGGGEILEPNGLERMFSNLESHPKCAVCQSKMRIINEQGKEEEVVASLNKPNKKHIRFAPNDWLVHFGGEQLFQTRGQLLIRRQLFEKTGYFDTQAEHPEFLWSFKISRIANVLYLPEPLISKDKMQWKMEERNRPSNEWLRQTAKRAIEESADEKQKKAAEVLNRLRERYYETESIPFTEEKQFKRKEWVWSFSKVFPFLKKVLERKRKLAQETFGDVFSREVKRYRDSKDIQILDE